MNNKQKAIAIAGGFGTFGAEALIGGLGIGVLGTAVAVPASAVVATVSVLTWLAAGDNVPFESKSPDQITDKDINHELIKQAFKHLVNKPSKPSKASKPSEMQTFLLRKGTVTHKISVNKERGWGQTCFQATSDASWTNYRYFCNIQDMRDLYKTLLSKGYQPA